MIITGPKTVITPQDIPTPKGGHFWNAFGHCETEISARWLVRFAKERGQGWEPFTEADIEKFYNAGGFRNFSFNRLISGSWIEEGGGFYHFTSEFISRCYDSATGR